MQLNRVVRFASATAFALAMGASLSASAIVVFIRPGRIVIAADSRRVDPAGNPSSGCKVRTAGKWAFSVAGLDVAFHKRTGGVLVDLNDVVTEAIAHVSTFDAAQAAMSKQVPAVIDAMLSGARQNVPGFRMYKPGSLVTQVILAGMDQTLRLAVTQYVLNQDWHVMGLVSVCPGALCHDGSMSLVASAAGGSDRVRGVLPDWVKRGDAAAATRIIEEEIEKTPGFVAAPIDVLELTNAGARWIDRDQASRCTATP